MIAITEAATDAEWDEACTLLHEVYVGEGHSPAERARQTLVRTVLEKGGTLLIAKHADGTVIGATLFLHAESELRQVTRAGEREFRVLAVGAEARGQGVGEALVRACIDRSRSSDATALVLWTRSTMPAAQRLYERLGFVRDPARDEPDPRGFQRLVYVHWLGP